MSDKKCMNVESKNKTSESKTSESKVNTCMKNETNGEKKFVKRVYTKAEADEIHLSWCVNRGVYG
jgi:hypothetical protein